MAKSKSKGIGKKAAMYYEPLAKLFHDVGASISLRDFCRIEAMLYLLKKHAPDADAKSASALLFGYNIIGREKGTPDDYELQCARDHLRQYHAVVEWQKALRVYRSPALDELRIFDFFVNERGQTDFRVREGHFYSYEEREDEWRRLIYVPEKEEVAEIASDGTFEFARKTPGSGEFVKRTIELEGEPRVRAVASGDRKAPCAPIDIPVAELLEAAERMKEWVPDDHCAEVLKSNALLDVLPGSVALADSLRIEKVCNLVGMVGAGKTTLVRVIAFWMRGKGRRMLWVVDTVDEVMRLWRDLKRYGLSVSPLIGKSDRRKRLDQFKGPDDSVLSPELSEYLTPFCLLDGLEEEGGGRTELGYDYAGEPCYFLKRANSAKKSKSSLCPYFDKCPATAMWRESEVSEIVVTSVASLALGKTGYRRELLLESAMRDFDLVVFDECDRIQQTLDQTFVSKVNFDEFLQQQGKEIQAFLAETGNERREKKLRNRYTKLCFKSYTVIDRVVLSMNRELGSWAELLKKRFLNPGLLLDHMEFSEVSGDVDEQETESGKTGETSAAAFDKGFVRDLRESIAFPDNDPDFWRAVTASCSDEGEEILFFELFESWWEKRKDVLERNKSKRDIEINKNQLQLFMRLIRMEIHLWELFRAREDLAEIYGAEHMLVDLFQDRFRKQQRFLPDAVGGNMFGVRKKENGEIELARYFAFGRSLMKDMPFLRVDPEGRPLGPNVLLLSGTSWAPGSFENHVNRPVSYILANSPEVRGFLALTKFYEGRCAARVSGVRGELKLAKLRELAAEFSETLIEVAATAKGKSLLIVNSYEQAAELASALKSILRDTELNGSVCCLISDSDESYGDGGNEWLKRGKVREFAGMKQRILIAPAQPIERGHNIIDEIGHSVLECVFFFTRSLPVPDDLKLQLSQLNGMVEANCVRREGESAYSFNQRFRRTARSFRKLQYKGGKFGIATLPKIMQTNLVASLFIRTLQIFGRLSRVRDTMRNAPRIYFVDGAFRGKSFDTIRELLEYFNKIMSLEEAGLIARTLYEPFITAFQESNIHDVYYDISDGGAPESVDPEEDLLFGISDEMEGGAFTDFL